MLPTGQNAYVAAQNERDTLWARQVLARGDYDKNARVINETKKISVSLPRWIPIIREALIIGFTSMSRVTRFRWPPAKHMSKKELEVLSKAES